MRPLVMVITSALVACPSPSPPPVLAPAPAPGPDTGGPEPTTTCAERLRARDGIDVAPEPRICPGLEAALDSLSAVQREAVKNLVIVRDARGPCGDRCPDLASALLSDGALAFYRVGRHELHVLDATLDGARWRGGAPSPAAIRAYLDALGLPDWAALVARLRTRPCISLPEIVPEGAPIVFEEIVRCGAPILLGGDAPLRDLLRHELGHAVMCNAKDESARIRSWGTLTDWRTRDGERADGYVRGFFASERPIVASRLALGLPRGDDSDYLPGRETLPTAYAAFDPMEDFAESFRLVVADPVALGRAAPTKLLVAGAGTLDLSRPELRPFISPGVRGLLAPGVDPELAIDTLRAHADALAREPALLDELHDPRPLPAPTGLHPEVATIIGSDRLVARIAGRTLRPHDETMRALHATIDHYLTERDELQKAIDALDPDASP